MIFPGVPGVTILVVMIVIGDFIPVLLVVPIKNTRGGEKHHYRKHFSKSEIVFKVKGNKQDNQININQFNPTFGKDYSSQNLL